MRPFLVWLIALVTVSGLDGAARLQGELRCSIPLQIDLARRGNANPYPFACSALLIEHVVVSVGSIQLPNQLRSICGVSSRLFREGDQISLGRPNYISIACDFSAQFCGGPPQSLMHTLIDSPMGNGRYSPGVL